jgi:hypothetical protein
VKAAIEERDRAEEKAMSWGGGARRLKIKIREVERARQRAEKDKEELEYGQREPSDAVLPSPFPHPAHHVIGSWVDIELLRGPLGLSFILSPLPERK